MPAERLTKLETRMDGWDKIQNSFENDVTDMRDDIKLIVKDVAVIREMIAEHRGAGAAIKYLTHAGAGIIGAAGAFFGIHVK